VCSDRSNQKWEGQFGLDLLDQPGYVQEGRSEIAICPPGSQVGRCVGKLGYVVAGAATQRSGFIDHPGHAVIGDEAFKPQKRVR